jgi:hypothetical protein
MARACQCGTRSGSDKATITYNIRATSKRFHPLSRNEVANQTNHKNFGDSTTI